MYITYTQNGDVNLMSFWSWIGLADKQELVALQSEISALRNENKSLQEQNQKLIETLEKTNKKYMDTIINELTNNSRKTNEQIQDTNGSIKLLASAISNSQKDIFNISSSMKERGEQIVQLLSISKELDKKADNMEDIQENIQLLAESTKYMWSIMKAIWVDSVLSDIDSIIQNDEKK